MQLKTSQSIMGNLTCIHILKYLLLPLNGINKPREPRKTDRVDRCWPNAKLDNKQNQLSYLQQTHTCFLKQRESVLEQTQINLRQVAAHFSCKLPHCSQTPAMHRQNQTSIRISGMTPCQKQLESSENYDVVACCSQEGTQRSVPGRYVALYKADFNLLLQWC